MNKSRTFAGLVVLAVAVSLGACSDDSYIATNQYSNSDSAVGGSGGSSGGDNDAAFGASGGVAGGSAGMAGAGTGGSSSCSPGEKENLGTCEKCGSSTRTCDENGVWSDPVCEGQGACNPGDTSTSGCSDQCQDKKCQNDCSWGACGLKAGAKCLYEAGSNFQCCGTDKWQFCNGATCDWHPCQDCQPGSSCLSAC